MPRKKGTYPWCTRESKIILHTELQAKIVLSDRIARDKGEVRYYKCPAHDHFHLTSQPLRSKLVDAE